MKKKAAYLFLVICLFLINNLNAQQLTTKSLSNFGNSGWDILSDITFDAEGNYYIAGSYSGIFKIDSDELTSMGQRDIFLVKFSIDNELLWKKQIGDAGDEHAYSIVCDNENSVYLAGAFSETLKIGGPNSALGITDLFLIKYNSSGIHQWTKAIPGSAPARKSFLRKDTEGFIWLAGNFSGQITIGAETLNSNNISNLFAAKFNTAGDIQSSFHLDNSNDIVLADVVTDNENNLYFAGYFKNRIEFGSFAFDAIGKKDAFIAKYNPKGVVTWLNTAGGYYNDIANCISLDQNGHVLIAGDFKDEISFSGNTTKINTTKSNEVFIASYASSNGQLAWVKKLGGNSSNFSTSLAMAENDKFYLNGTFKGRLKDGEAPINSLKQSKDVYIGRFDTEGNEEMLIQAGGDHEDLMQVEYSPSTKSLMVSGQFSSEFKLLNDSVDNQDYKDVFFGQIVDCATRPGIELGDDKNACENLELSVENNYVSYSWNNTQGTNSFMVNETGLVNLEVVDKYGCHFSDEVMVTINNDLTIDLGGDQSFCEGNSINLTAGPAGRDYLWDDGSTESSREITQPGTYLVTLNEENCTATDEITVTVTLPPVVELGPDRTIDTDIYLDGGAGQSSYQWSSGQDCRLLFVPMSAIEQTTEISVVVTDPNGCTTKDSVVLSPQTMSPPVMAYNNPDAHLSSLKSGDTNPSGQVQEKEDNSLSNGPADFKLFPNPTDGKLTLLIPWPEKVRFVNIYNIQGNLIKSIKGPTSHQLEMNLGNYSKGTYLIKIIGRDKQEDFKIIRN